MNQVHEVHYMKSKWSNPASRCRRLFNAPTIIKGSYKKNYC